MARRLRIGLTGGIASGKSTVAQRFAELGIPVIDADVAARAVVEPGTPGLAQVVERFGSGVLDAQGALDRRALRDLIFNDPGARRDLEAILHPLIRAAMERERRSGRRPLRRDGHPPARRGRRTRPRGSRAGGRRGRIACSYSA